MEKDLKFKISMGVLAGVLAVGTAVSTLVVMKVLKCKKNGQSIEIVK